MEQMFHRHSYAFFLEFKMFGFYFAKTITSFLKMTFELMRLLVIILRSIWHLLFEGPSLIKWHSPNHYTHVERSTPANFPRMF